MSYQLWSWLLTIVGITGFIITGWLKQWWGWYINIFCQILWILYAIFTQQWGFIASALIYTVIFGGSIVRHYRDRKKTAFAHATSAHFDPDSREATLRAFAEYRNGRITRPRSSSNSSRVRHRADPVSPAYQATDFEEETDL